MKAKFTRGSNSQKQEFLHKLFLGTKNAVHWYTGDEHNEMGNINDEPIIRRRMMDKRLKKLELVDRDVPSELKINFFGDKDADTIIVSSGFAQRCNNRSAKSTQR